MKSEKMRIIGVVIAVSLRTEMSFCLYSGSAAKANLKFVSQLCPTEPSQTLFMPPVSGFRVALSMKQ